MWKNRMAKEVRWDEDKEKLFKDEFSEGLRLTEIPERSRGHSELDAM